MKTPRLAVSRCQACSKWWYATRKDARKTAREGHPEAHMDIYRCPVNPRYWHYGHMHYAIVQGRNFIARRL